MSRYKYLVTDSLGNYMQSFSSWEAACNYKYTRGNSQWKIKSV